MKRASAKFPKIRILISLIVVVLSISMVGPAEAMFVPSIPHSQTGPGFDRAADMAKIQKVLESKALQQRLVDYGLTPEAALAKINGLSDEQVHRLATNIDALQAGGSIGHVIIIMLLIILIIILV